MAIPPELQFANEAEFVSRFIRPLLGRLGYSVIADYHGPGEYGKDIVFADFDKFGQVTYHAIQAKYVPSVSLSESNQLVEQCKLAYGNPFRHPHSGEIHRINSFYVLNGGTFSEQARESFFRQLDNPFGGSIRLIDGPALVMLDRYSSITNVADTRHQLVGLHLEHTHNTHIAKALQKQLETYLAEGDKKKRKAPIDRLRHTALDQYLVAPMLSDRMDTASLLQHGLLITNANTWLSKLPDVPNKEDVAQAILITLSQLEINFAAFLTAISELIQMLGPLSPTM